MGYLNKKDVPKGLKGIKIAGYNSKGKYEVKEWELHKLTESEYIVIKKYIAKKVDIYRFDSQREKWGGFPDFLIKEQIDKYPYTLEYWLEVKTVNITPKQYQIFPLIQKGVHKYPTEIKYEIILSGLNINVTKECYVHDNFTFIQKQNELLNLKSSIDYRESDLVGKERNIKETSKHLVDKVFVLKTEFNTYCDRFRNMLMTYLKEDIEKMMIERGIIKKFSPERTRSELVGDGQRGAERLGEDKGKDAP